VIRKKQLVVPLAFEAVQLTMFVPFGKVLPEGGMQVTIGVGVPLAEGENVTTAEH